MLPHRLIKYTDADAWMDLSFADGKGAVIRVIHMDRRKRKALGLWGMRPGEISKSLK